MYRIMTPCVVKEMIEYHSKRRMCSPNLYDFANASSPQTVQIPADDLILPVSQKYFSKASVRVHSGHEIQQPPCGLSLVFRPKRMRRGEVAQTSNFCLRRQFFFRDQSCCPTERSGCHPGVDAVNHLADLLD